MALDRNSLFLEEMMDNFRYDVAPQLNQDDFINLGETNKFFHTLFYSQYKNAVHEKLKKLFECTLLRDQDKVSDILQKSPHFLWRKATVSELFLDEAGNRRRFKSISPLQYVVWARDIPMLYWMLLYSTLFYAPEPEKLNAMTWIKGVQEAVKRPPWLTYQLGELREQIKALLKFVPLEFVSQVMSQLDELKNNGTEHGSCYNWRPLSNLSKDYKRLYDIYDKDPAQYQDSIEASWRTIGVLQYKSVLHVIHEYSRHDKRATKLTFDTDYLPRENKICHTENYLNKLQSLEDYGIYRGESYPAFNGIYCSSDGVAQEQDGIMIEQLFAAREIQLNHLYDLLASNKIEEKLVGVDPDVHMVSPLIV